MSTGRTPSPPRARRFEKAAPALGVVVVTHDGAANCMLGAANALLGGQTGLTAVNCSVGEPQHALIERIAQACRGVDDGAGVLILVDVHGSSPFHAAMTMLDGTRPAEVLCGVNLPMLIKLSTCNRRNLTPGELAEILRDIGRRSIRLGSELTGKVTVEEGR